MGIEYEKTGRDAFEVRTPRHAVDVTLSGDAPVAVVRDVSTGSLVLDTAENRAVEYRAGGVQFSATSETSFVLRLPDACIEATAEGGALGAEIWDTPWPTADEHAVASIERANGFGL